MRHAGHVALGALTYLLTLGSVDPLDIAAAVLLAGALAAGARRHLEPERRAAERPPLLRRLAAVPGLAGATLAQIVRGTIDVSRVSLRPSRLGSPGFVEIPLPTDSDAGVTALAALRTLSPGEFPVDVDRERGVLIMHVLDASDPDAVRRDFESFFRDHVRRVMP